MTDFYRWFVDPATPTEAEVTAKMDQATKSRGAAERQAAIAEWRAADPTRTCSEAAAWALMQMAKSVGRKP